jgi:nitroreductase
MGAIETIRTRRSIRKFTDDKISEEQINLLKETALRSPSSRNLDPWKFWFVQSPALLKELAKAKISGSQLLDGAKLAIVIGGDENISDCWVEDCSIAAIFLQLAAQDLGLGSCWVQIRNRNSQECPSENFVRNLLNIKETNMRIGSIIAIGKPAENRTPLKFDDLDFTKIKDL